MWETVNEVCRAALLEAQRYANQIVAGAISPSDGADRIASELGDCYTYLGQDIDLVGLLGAFSAYADEYQEFSLDPAKLKEIDADIVAAAREFMQIADTSGL
jgi:hypothetical protein